MVRRRRRKNNVLFWIVLALIFLYFYNPIGRESDIESQLKQEYTTYWGDKTDENRLQDISCEKIGCYITRNTDFANYLATTERPACAELLKTGRGCSFATKEYRGLLFNVMSSGNADFSTDNNINLFASHSTVGKVTLETTNIFRGQEVVTLHSSSDTNSQLVLTKYIPHTFNPSIYDVVIDGVKTREIDVGDGLRLTFSIEHSGVRSDSAVSNNIHFIGYKAQFECDLSDEEVWIQETFTSQFNINDLEFAPTKFCDSTRPFVLRKLDEGETAIRREEGIFPFNRGETIPSRALTEGEVVVVNYATYFVQGVNHRCDVNEANVWDGEKWVCQSIIEPVTIVVQCEENTDCPVPLKNECPGYFQGCVNNLCQYDNTILDSVECKNEVVTIVKQTEIVQEQVIIDVDAENVFTFTNNWLKSSFNFGDQKFSASNLDYVCSIPNEDGLYRVPYGGNNCWQTTTSFMGQTQVLNNLDEVEVNPYITYKYIASGTLRVDYDEANNQPFSEIKKEQWSNSFIFTINDGIKVDLLSLEREVLLGSDKSINIQITNNLPRNTNAFVKFKQIASQTNEIIQDVEYEINLATGANTYSIPGFETENLGIHKIEIQVFYVIDADREVFIPSDKIITGYLVVDRLSSEPDYVVISKEVMSEDVVYVYEEVPIIVQGEPVIEQGIPLYESTQIGTKRSGIPLWVWLILGLFVGFLIMEVGPKRGFFRKRKK